MTLMILDMFFTSWLIGADGDEPGPERSTNAEMCHLRAPTLARVYLLLQR